MLLTKGFAAGLTKGAGVGTAAKATAGLGIAVAGVTGAGAVGALPIPVQNGVAGVIESATLFTVPHGSGAASTAGTPAASVPTEPGQSGNADNSHPGTSGGGGSGEASIGGAGVPATADPVRDEQRSGLAAPDHRRMEPAVSRRSWTIMTEEN